MNPGIGFALSFVECISWLFYVGVAATLFTTMGLIPLFALFGSGTSSILKWLATPFGQLIIGTAVILVAALLLIWGTRKYFRVQKVAFLLAILGAIILMLVLASHTSVPHFAKAFQDSAHLRIGNAYEQVITKATAVGWLGGTPQTATGSWPLLVWPFLALIGGAFSIGIGGEVQQHVKNQLWGILGSIIAAGSTFIVIAILAAHAIGDGFLCAIAFNYDHGLTAFSTSFPPYIAYFAGLLTLNPLLRAMIALGFVVWAWFWIPGVLSYVERAFLAWSLDRVGPAPLAKMHPRWSTPYVAVIVGALVAEMFLCLYLYTTFFATLVFILAAGIAWLITLVAGMLYPYRNRKLYALSPLARYKLFGVPLMTIVCALGTFALALVVYLLWNDPVAAGHGAASLWTITVTFFLGAVFYLVTKAIRKRQGIDIGAIYNEIPVE